jgi:hypothetical protein
MLLSLQLVEALFGYQDCFTINVTFWIGLLHCRLGSLAVEHAAKGGSS